MYGHQLITNRYTGPGFLSFITHEDVQLHVHASNEIPYDIESDIKEDIFYGSKKEIIIKVIDMMNDADVQDSSISRRKCRFPWERNESIQQKNRMLYNQYSHSTCAIECSMDIQLELCNCSHHLMPSSNENMKTCDIDGLICLTNNFGKLFIVVASICDIVFIVVVTTHFSFYTNYIIFNDCKHFFQGKINSMKRDCSCVASCDEPEYNVLYSSAKE